jgi:hypothetical protein
MNFEPSVFFFPRVIVSLFRPAPKADLGCIKFSRDSAALLCMVSVRSVPAHPDAALRRLRQGASAPRPSLRLGLLHPRPSAPAHVLLRILLEHVFVAAPTSRSPPSRRREAAPAAQPAPRCVACISDAFVHGQTSSFVAIKSSTSRSFT